MRPQTVVVAIAAGSVRLETAPCTIVDANPDIYTLAFNSSRDSAPSGERDEDIVTRFAPLPEWQAGSFGGETAGEDLVLVVDSEDSGGRGGP